MGDEGILVYAGYNINELRRARQLRGSRLSPLA